MLFLPWVKKLVVGLIDAFTNAVVAIAVELSLVVGVGAVGLPVNAGEASGAYDDIPA